MNRLFGPRGRLFLAFAALTVLLLAPPRACGCACGCEVFEVGTGSIFPIQPGTQVDIEYDYQNQDRNWSGSGSSPAVNNDDRNIRTRFYTVGLRRMFDRRWGASVRIPYWDRHFLTADDGDPATFNHGAAGDIRIQAIYTGFSPDMSTGMRFGLKLPSGDHTYAGFDPDTEIGTGSTDLLVGVHHLGRLPGGDWSWFVSFSGQQALWHLKDYRPGGVFDGTAGVSHHGWTLGGFHLLPMGQLIADVRGHDSGSEAAPGDTGFERLLLAPGADLHWRNLHLFGNIGLRIWQHVRGNQLVAPSLLKLDLGIDL